MSYNYLPFDVDYSFYNLMIVLKMNNIEPSTTKEFLTANPKLFENIFGMSYRVIISKDDRIYSKYFKKIDDNYPSFYQLSWSEIFHKYPIDYIVCDQNDINNYNCHYLNDEHDAFKLMYDKNGIKLYKIL